MMKTKPLKGSVFPHTRRVLATNAFLGRNVTADVRNYYARKLSAMGVRSTMHYLYPRMLALHDLNDEIALPEANGRVDLPSLMRDSHLFMESHGVYLIGMLQLYTYGTLQLTIYSQITRTS